MLGLLKMRETETGAQLPAVFVSTARMDIVDTLAELTGVSVTTVVRKYNRVGCGEHCTEAHMHVNSTTGRWSLTGARCTVFLSALLPYLTSNREEAEKAVAAGMDAPFKAATVEKMYALGWPKISG